MRSLERTYSVSIPKAAEQNFMTVFRVFSRVRVRESGETKPKETVVYRIHGPTDDLALLNALLGLES